MPKTPPQWPWTLLSLSPCAKPCRSFGRFVAKQTGDIAARVAGAVEVFNVDVGDRVQAGDIIAHLVRDTFEWRLNRTKSEVQTAKAALQTKNESLKLVRQELKRLEGLKKSPAFSQARMDDKKQETVRARSEITEARAQLSSAEADMHLAEISLYNTDIRAPYPGVVTAKHTEIGAYVSAGNPVVTILNDEELEIEADVPYNRVDGLSKGFEVTGILGNGFTMKAAVRAVVPDENPRTRTRRVRFTLLGGKNGQTLAANQSVTVDIPAGEVRDVLTIHKDAILNRQGQQLVVISADGKAQFRPVKLGEAIGRRFVLLGGLKEGDEVVVRGNERVQPGQAIQAVNGSQAQ